MTTMGPAFDREYALLSKIEALTIERDCYKAALERIAAHGCCVMHNDSGCPGCGAKDALAGKSRQSSEPASKVSAQKCECPSEYSGTQAKLSCAALQCERAVSVFAGVACDCACHSGEDVQSK